VTTKVLSVILMVFVARYLGGAGFGKYTFVYSLISFLTVFTGFGLDTIIIRDVAREKSKSSYYLVNSAYLKLFLCAVSLGILFALIPFLGKGRAVNLGLLIVGLSLLPMLFMACFESILMAHEMMSDTTALEIIFRALVVGMGFMVIILNYGLVALFLVYLVAGLIMVPVWAAVYRKKVGPMALRPDKTFLLQLLRQGVPFALAGIFVSMYFRMDTVMLSFMKGDLAVGLYNAAFGLVESLLFISTAICTALFPVLSRLYGDSRETFDRAYQKTFKLLFFCPCPSRWGRPFLQTASSCSSTRLNSLMPRSHCEYWYGLWYSCFSMCFYPSSSTRRTGKSFWFLPRGACWS